MPVSRQHTKDTIPDFPSSIDRDVFGAWLSGFVDGEGCFHLALGKGGCCLTLKAEIIIQLRVDDAHILGLIRSFWKCGRLNNVVHLRGVRLTVSRIKQLSRIVVPHFEHFPLFAKKRNDFVIWREAVMLLDKINDRPYRVRHDGRGGLPKCSSEEHTLFVSLKQKLQDGRKLKGDE